jgi:uncharacterized membrane protein
MIRGECTMCNSNRSPYHFEKHRLKRTKQQYFYVVKLNGLFFIFFFSVTFIVFSSLFQVRREEKTFLFGQFEFFSSLFLFFSPSTFILKIGHLDFKGLKNSSSSTDTFILLFKSILIICIYIFWESNVSHYIVIYIYIERGERQPIQIFKVFL